MPSELKVSIGQHSDKGRKAINQDFHGALIPEQPALGLKGIAIAIADGISSSSVSQVASESAIKGFLTDYYCTSDSWSVKTSAQRVIAATNSWLHSQTRRSQYAYDKDKGYCCTLSVVVIKSTTAHIFHIGDGRVYRVRISAEESYLGRALGANPQIEIDYCTVQLKTGDVLVMATDGVYEHAGAGFIVDTITANAQDLDRAAKAVAVEAYNQGSPDNLTLQIIRIDDLPPGEASEALGQAAELPLPPLLEPRMIFDGYKIVRQIHASSRSHIYLAVDTASEDVVALKIPSIDLRGDAAYLRRFMMEEWVARRITSAHVLKPCPQPRKPNYVYVAMEYVEGKTLAQWMIDNPAPDLETVRGIVEQIARGLRAFHRLEMLHQDVRPQNILIDKTGSAKIIDFGSVKVTGVIEASPAIDANDVLGTAQYTAPEYFLGEGGTSRSDLFSLGVITYQMLTGKLPYGAEAARARTRSQQRKLTYKFARNSNREIPEWVDKALRKAVHPDPAKRYEALSEFVHDLRHPKEEFLRSSPVPLLERDPVLFWKGLALALACVVVLLLAFPIR